MQAYLQRTSRSIRQGTTPTSKRWIGADGSGTLDFEIATMADERVTKRRPRRRLS